MAEQVGFEDVSWVIVSDVAWSEAKEAVNDYTRRLLITAAILLPIVGLLGLLLADRMTRPVDPVVAAAADVAAGDLTTEVPDLGRNEYGDVGRRINTFTADLRAQHEALMEEAHEVESCSGLPFPTASSASSGSGDRQLEDLADTATVIALTATGSLVMRESTKTGRRSSGRDCRPNWRPMRRTWASNGSGRREAATSSRRVWEIPTSPPRPPPSSRSPHAHSSRT